MRVRADLDRCSRTDVARDLRILPPEPDGCARSFSSFWKYFWAWDRTWTVVLEPTTSATFVHFLPKSSKPWRKRVCSSSVHRPVFSPVVVVGGGAETWAAVGGWHILARVFFAVSCRGPPFRRLACRGRLAKGFCRWLAFRRAPPYAVKRALFSPLPVPSRSHSRLCVVCAAWRLDRAYRALALQMLRLASELGL